MWFVFSACVTALVLVSSAACGAGGTPTGPSTSERTPTGPSPAVTTRLEIGIGQVSVRRSIFAPFNNYSMTVALGVTPWPLPSDSRLTVQGAETTLFGPDGSTYHTHVHSDLIDVRWDSGSHQYYQADHAFRTIFNDYDLARPEATRYRMVIVYAVSTPSDTQSLVVSATGSIVRAPF